MNSCIAVKDHWKFIYTQIEEEQKKLKKKSGLTVRSSFRQHMIRALQYLQFRQTMTMPFISAPAPGL